MDYPCGKIGDCGFSRFEYIFLAEKLAHRERETRMNALLPRLSSAWLNNEKTHIGSLYLSLTPKFKT